MRDETFTVEDGWLVRAVVPRRGQPYEHRCSKDSFDAIAHAIDEFDGSFRIQDLRERTDLPWTQVAVAFAFLKERGCIVPIRGRRWVAATSFVYEDAMIEFHALAEGASHNQEGD